MTASCWWDQLYVISTSLHSEGQQDKKILGFTSALLHRLKKKSNKSYNAKMAVRDYEIILGGGSYFLPSRFIYRPFTD